MTLLASATWHDEVDRLAGEALDLVVRARAVMPRFCEQDDVDRGVSSSLNNAIYFLEDAVKLNAITEYDEVQGGQ